nr:B3 domain-containing protein Os03g0212300-like [Lolium perenne]
MEEADAAGAAGVRGASAKRGHTGAMSRESDGGSVGKPQQLCKDMDWLINTAMDELLSLDRGRGRGSGSSSLPPPPSTLPLIIEEFFIVVYEDPLVKKELPKKFADYLDGKEPAKVYLRAADCGPRLWTVEVLFDGQGRMYLDKGWEKFAIAHGVDFGWFVHFKYEGDDVLTVKVFDGTMCRRYYYSDDEDTDDESDDDVKPCIHPL